MKRATSGTRTKIPIGATGRNLRQVPAFAVVRRSAVPVGVVLTAQPEQIRLLGLPRSSEAGVRPDATASPPRRRRPSATSAGTRQTTDTEHGGEAGDEQEEQTEQEHSHRLDLPGVGRENITNGVGRA